MRKVPDPTRRPENATPGYHITGMSAWSRDCASRMGWTPNMRPRGPRRKQSAHELLMTQEDQLAKLQAKLRVVGGVHREKLERDLDAKIKFIERLKKEIAAA